MMGVVTWEWWSLGVWSLADEGRTEGSVGERNPVLHSGQGEVLVT